VQSVTDVVPSNTGREDAMTTPDELARICDLAVTAHWRGEDAAAEAIVAWLEAH
jgi:hypothetical protein